MDEIERLVDWLDSSIDCDQDCAADDVGCDDAELEPSLGSFDRMSDQVRAWAAAIPGGYRGVDDCELDRADNEPALAAPENHPELPFTTMGHFDGQVVHAPPGEYRDRSGSQEYWAAGNADEREGDGCADDREGDSSWGSEFPLACLIAFFGTFTIASFLIR